MLFGWGSDHLHVFRAGRRTLAASFFHLEEAQDEDDARLSRLLAAGVRNLTYTYTWAPGGSARSSWRSWSRQTPGQTTLRCVAFAGDCPLEYAVLQDDDGNPIADPVHLGSHDLL